MREVIETDFQEVDKLLYINQMNVDYAVLEVNTVDGDETDQTGEFTRVAGTDGEEYAVSTPLQSKDPEDVKRGLREVDQALSRGTGHSLGADNTTAEYLADERPEFIY